MEDDIKRYDKLCEELKYQIQFINEFAVFDFEYFQNTLNEAKELQKKINTP